MPGNCISSTNSCKYIEITQSNQVNFGESIYKIIWKPKGLSPCPAMRFLSAQYPYLARDSLNSFNYLGSN